MAEYVINRGTTFTKGMIIGEAPGADEERESIPFVGKAGRLLQDTFHKMGSDIDNYYVTNAYKLRPPANRTPNKEELLAHYPALMKEIELIDPIAILALGNAAYQTLVKTELGITKIRERTYRDGGYDLAICGRASRVVPCFHPAYILRQPGKLDKFEADIKLFLKLVEGD